MPEAFAWISARFGNLGWDSLCQGTWIFLLFFLFYLSHSQEQLGRKYCKILTNFSLKSSSPPMLWQRRCLCMRRYLCLIKTIQPRCRFVAPWRFSAKVSEVTLSVLWFFPVRSAAHAGRACCTPRLWVRHEKKQLCINCLGAAVGSRDPWGCAEQGRFLTVLLPT